MTDAQQIAAEAVKPWREALADLVTAHENGVLTPAYIDMARALLEGSDRATQDEETTFPIEEWR